MEETNALVGAIQKFSVEDGPGIRTTVFLKGCPLACRWCHNPELIDPAQQLIQMPNSCIHCGACIRVCPKEAVYADTEGRIQIHWDRCDRCLQCTESCYAEALQPVAQRMTVSRVMEEVVQDKGFYEHTGGGMTISGGELLMHPDFVRGLLAAAGEEGIGVCLDTSGQGDSGLLAEAAAMEHVTDILYDIKAVDSGLHEALTGVGSQLIQANLKRLCENEAVRRKIMVRMPLIHGLNDSSQAIGEVIDIMKARGLTRATLLPYHDLGVGKKTRIGGVQEMFSPPPAERMDAIVQAMEEAGIEISVLGQRR